MNIAFTWSESKRASNYEIRIISFRKSTQKESEDYFNEIQI